jgi:AcrR family transcriptional regulator
MARGTVYNNIKDPENLFGEIASALSHEMMVRTEATIGELGDPAERIATGLRLFIRRAHEEHDWGRFLVRFALSHAALRGMMLEPPARDIRNAMLAGRFKIDEAKIPILVTMLAGATMATMNAVIRGDQAWREAGSNTAELFLRAGGLSVAEARRVSRTELAPLSPPPPPSPRPPKRRTS